MINAQTAILKVNRTSIDENGGEVIVTVELSAAAGSQINATLQITGTSSPTDYSINNATNANEKIITIPTGNTSGFLKIKALNDSNVEDNETIIIKLNSVNTGSVGSSNEKTVSIRDDDLIISLALVGSDTILDEAAETAKLTTSINEAVSSDITIQVGSVSPKNLDGTPKDNSASSGDISFSSRTVVIPSGSTSVDFEITTVNDTNYEPNEIFYAKNMNIVSGLGTIKNDSIGFTIIDDEPPFVTLSVDTTQIGENGGVATVKVLLSRTHSSTSTITLDFEGFSSTATLNTDFSSASTTIAIAAGDTVGTVQITAIDDNFQDPNEKIVVEISSLVSALEITTQRVSVFIVDDEIPPIAVTDTYSGSNCVLEGGALTISDKVNGLLANDSLFISGSSKMELFDPNTDNLTIALLAPASDGFVTCPSTGLPGICSDGTFKYTHSGDETPTGIDQFSYRITDGNGFTSNGIVSICVTPVNDCPQPLADGINVDEGKTVTGDVLSNDTDVEFVLGISDTLNVSLTTALSPALGSFTLNTDGTYSYTAPAYLSGSDPVNLVGEYTVDDGQCQKTAAIRITINNTVPLPLADTFVVGIGASLTIAAPGVLVNDPIPAGATKNSYIITEPKNDINSAFQLNADGSFTYTHNGSSSPKLDSFSYKLLVSYPPFPGGGSDYDGIAKVFVKVNDCPQVQQDFYTVNENDSILVSSPGILDNDTDVNGDPITSVIETPPKSGKIVINPDGSFKYIHDGGEEVSDFFVYKAFDGICLSQPDTVFISINPVNDCPETKLDGYNSLGLREGKSINQYLTDLGLSIDSVDTDVSGDTLFVYTGDTTWVENMDEGGTMDIPSPGIISNDKDTEGDSIYTRGPIGIGGPFGCPIEYQNPDGSCMYELPSIGDAVVNADGSFTFKHDGSNVLRDEIYYESCDLAAVGACCTLDSIMLIFGPDNSCAQAQPDYYSTTEGGTVNANIVNYGYNEVMKSLTKRPKTPNGVNYGGVFKNDIDEEGDSLLIVSLTKPSHGVVVGDTIYPDGSFTYVHDGSETNFDSFQYTIVDLPHAPNECATATVFINILSVNDCPVAVEDIYTVDEGGTLTIPGTGSYLSLPAIMNNDIDIDIGATPMITDSLIAFYPMNEFYDTVSGNPLIVDLRDTLPSILTFAAADDLSSNNFDGTLKGGNMDTTYLPIPPGANTPAPTPDELRYSHPPTPSYDRFIPPKEKNAFFFDGDSAFIEVSHDVLSLNRKNYSVSGWFLSYNKNKNSTILNFPIAGQENGLTISTKDGLISFAIGNGVSYTVRLPSGIGGALNNSEWYHFVLTKNGDAYKFYLNNTEIFSQTLNNSTLSSAKARLLMGKGVSGNHLWGKIDEVYIFSQTLTRAEVMGLYYGLKTSLANLPDDGVITAFDSDGSFTYVHDGNNIDLQDNFFYDLSDGSCISTGKVIININPVNDCPISQNDTIYVDEGGTVKLDPPGILLNDSDEEGDTLTSKKISDPQHGIGTISGDTLTYIHDGSETILDSLTYVSNDGTCDGDTATIYVIINPVDDCPIPKDDVYEILEGGTLTIDTCNTTITNPGSNNENWALNEPNDQPGENVAEIYSNGTWNDEKNISKMNPHLLEVGAIITSKPGYKYLGQYDGHTYFESNTSSLWADARTAAVAAGGTLAMLKTKAENDAVIPWTNKTLFFGLWQDETDIFFVEPTGGWKWLDGTYLYDEGDSTYTICGILLNDNGANGDTLFVSWWESADHGVITPTFDGKFEYTHDGSEFNDTIPYNINNGLCDGDTANIIIKIIPVNDCPVAVVDTFYVDEGATLDTTGVLLNDIDVDGDALRAEKITGSNTNHGVVNIFPNGRLTYTHDGGETKIDSVQYKVIDPSACDSTAMVYIIINPVNDLPVGTDDNYSVNEGDTLIVDALKGLLSNDVDNDGDVLKIFIVDNPSNGDLTLNDDGSFTYIHDGTDKPNEVCFTYRLFDGTDFSLLVTKVCFTILNRVPITIGEIYSVNEGEVLNTNLKDGVLLNDDDKDPQDIMTAILLDAPKHGAFILEPDGTFTYDHDCSDTPNVDFFTYYVTDGEDTTAVADTAKINIINICPIGNDDLYTGVDEGGTLNIGAFDGVLSNDFDQNPCDILQIKILSPTSFGTLVLKADGSFDYTHDHSENFEDVFTYLLNDGECPDDTVTVIIRITPVPDTPPVAVGDTYPCVDEGGFIQTLTYDDGVLFNDYDLDTGSTLQAVIVSYPVHGTLILNPNGTFIYTHDGGESTADSFSYYVKDNTDLISDIVKVTLCINPINDCPIPVDDIFNINEGDIIDTTLIFNDFDIEGNPLQINITTPPSIGGLSWDLDGSITYAAPENISSPGPEIITFDYILSDDGFNKCDSTATVTIIINYENDCPIALDDSIIVDGSIAGSRIITVLDNDSDPDSEIDTTSINIISGPSFGEAITNLDGTITFNYDVSPASYDTITYSVSDYEGCAVIAKVYIYIENVLKPKYKLPNYFTPNGDDFNDFFVIKYENILEEYISFEVKIYDRYQRLVYSGYIKGDKIWNGSNSVNSQDIKTDFYYYEVTPVEYYGTSYERRKDKLVGTIYLEKER